MTVQLEVADGLRIIHVSDFVVRSGNLVSSFVISIYLRGHLYMYTRPTLLPEAALPLEATTPPGTCPAEPLRTGEYNQHV
jgi:hypothetical protein